MSTLTISDLDHQLSQRLHERAIRHGLSIEDEVRAILHQALDPHRGPKGNLAASVRGRFGPLGGVELEGCGISIVDPWNA